MELRGLEPLPCTGWWGTEIILTTALFGGLCGAGIDAGNHDIDQFGDAPPGVTVPACRVRDGIVDTGFGAPDDDRAAVPIDDVDRGDSDTSDVTCPVASLNIAF